MYGGTSASERASYFVSWGMIADTPLAGAIGVIYKGLSRLGLSIRL
jgi:hypothetical protein